MGVIYRVLPGLLLGLLSLLPRRLLQAIGGWLGQLNLFLDARAAKVTRTNLALCLPSMSDTAREQLTRQSLIETGRTMLETPAVWLGETDNIDNWIAGVNGENVLEKAVAAPRGLVVLLPHVGNWELFNIYYRRFGTMTALYQPPRNEAFHALMEEVRSKHGNNMVATDRSGLRELYRVLKRGETVVVLPDQVPETGEYIDFFGQLALTDTLIYRLLKATGADLITAAVIRGDDGRFTVKLMQPAEESFSTDQATALTAINREVQRSAELDLAQYQWEYKRFRERPTGLAKIYRFGKTPEYHT